MLTMKYALMGEEFTVALTTARYEADNSLYIGMVYYDEDDECWEFFDDLTVCLSGEKVDDSSTCSFINTENSSGALKLIRDYQLAVPTGVYKNSGFCAFPQFEFNMEEVSKYLFPEG